MYLVRLGWLGPLLGASGTHSTRGLDRVNKSDPPVCATCPVCHGRLRRSVMAATPLFNTTLDQVSRLPPRTPLSCTWLAPPRTIIAPSQLTSPRAAPEARIARTATSLLTASRPSTALSNGKTWPPYPQSGYLHASVGCIRPPPPRWNQAEAPPPRDQPQWPAP